MTQDQNIGWITSVCTNLFLPGVWTIVLLLHGWVKNNGVVGATSWPCKTTKQNLLSPTFCSTSLLPHHTLYAFTLTQWKFSVLHTGNTHQGCLVLNWTLWREAEAGIRISPSFLSCEKKMPLFLYTILTSYVSLVSSFLLTASPPPTPPGLCRPVF